MISISHTSKDKAIVEPIANRLAQVYGQEKVFYDSWSIQPGDGIIDKMNEGLAICKYFFFFVSKNSLLSNMVKLEWQNAIMKATNAQTKLIPVKLDDCMMPAILLQTLYIDVFGKGLENAIRQMIDVINGNNTYSGGYQLFENIRADISMSENELTIEFRAEVYLEPISKYVVLLKNDEAVISHSCLSDSLYNNGFNTDLRLNNGIVCNGLAFIIHRATAPGFPVRVQLKSKSKINFLGLLRARSENEYVSIPYIIKKS